MLRLQDFGVNSRLSLSEPPGSPEAPLSFDLLEVPSGITSSPCFLASEAKRFSVTNVGGYFLSLPAALS